MSNPLSLGDWPPLDAGRGPAGQALLDWVADPGAPRLCLVTGSEGAGKSHLLAWFTSRAAEHPAARVHALLPAAGLGLGPAVWELSHQLGWGTRSLTELLDHAALDDRPLLIAVPDLHLVSTTVRRSGARLVPDLLQPLLRLPWVRVLAEVRAPSDSGFTHDTAVIDLDDPGFTDPEAYAAWYGALAAGVPNGPVPADEVFPHPVLGLLAARLPGGTVPPSAAGTTARRVCTAWWDSVDVPVRGALRTLALARGRVAADTWRALHTGLHPGDPGAGPAVDAAAELLAPQQATFQLPLGLLGDLAARSGGDGSPAPTGRQVTDVLLSLVPKGPGGVPDWSRAPAYVRDHITGHAAAEGRAGRLLSDPGFLVHGTPSAVTQALDDPSVTVPPSLRLAWYPAAPALSRALPEAAERGAVLHASALATAPRLAELLAPLAEHNHAVARWSHLRLAVPVVTPGGAPDGSRPDPVCALALTGPRDSGPAELVAADPLGQLRLLDPGTGRTSGRIINSPCLPVTGVAPLADGSLVLLDPAGTVRPLPSVDTALAGALARHNDLDPDGRARTTALGGDVRGGLLVLGDILGTAHLYDLRGGEPAPLTARLANAQITAIGCLRLPGGDAAVFAAAADGQVRLWGAPGDPLGAPLSGRESVPTALAVAECPGGPLVAVAWADHTITLLRPGVTRTRAVYPHHDVTSLALTPHGLLVAGGSEGVTAWQCGAAVFSEA